MTEQKIAPQALLEKISGAELLRNLLGFALQWLTKLEAEDRRGTGYWERSAERLNQRSGHREREWQTWVGTVGAAGAEARRIDRQCRGGCARSHGVPQRLPAKINSTNPLEQLSGEIKRCTDVLGILPGETTIIGLAGAILLEQNGGWALQCRYMSLETHASLGETAPVSFQTEGGSNLPRNIAPTPCVGTLSVPPRLS